LIDLAEDEDRLAGGLGVGVERVGEFGALGDLVGQQRGIAVARVTSHELDVTGEDAVALGDVVRIDRPHDGDVGLSDIRHDALLLPTGRAGNRLWVSRAAGPAGPRWAAVLTTAVQGPPSAHTSAGSVAKAAGTLLSDPTTAARRIARGSLPI